MKISIIGTGYVGLVTGTCLANFGLEVTCVDNDIEKINLLTHGKVPIFEANLEELIKKNVQENRLSFTTDIKKAVEISQVIYIAVGTPPNHDGSASMIQVEEVAKEIARFINEYKVIVNKCTSPVGTARKIKKIITENQMPSSLQVEKEGGSISSSINPGDLSTYHQCQDYSSVIDRSEATKQFQSISFDIIANPEFLREGSAVQDFTHPDKIVIGYETEKAKQIMQEIYRPLYLLDTPFVFTTLETAEMIKYACNAFLATKITFINEIANLCDRVGGDVHQIAKAMGMDGRISSKFLHPGPGYGGSCFPKDTRALQSFALNEQYDFKLIKAVIEANSRQREMVFEKIQKALGDLSRKTIAILGLAFKQNTDDIRESAAIDIINLLRKQDVTIRCFDPMAMENTRKILPDIIYCKNEYQTAKDSDALVILTEWDQFRNLDLNRIKSLMKNAIFLDIKNLYEPEKVKQLGFTYYGIGRN